MHFNTTKAKLKKKKKNDLINEINHDINNTLRKKNHSDAYKKKHREWFC